MATQGPIGSGGSVHGHTPSYPIDASWYMDTAATDHMTNEMDKIPSSQPYLSQDKDHLANGSGMHVTHIGQSSLPTSTSRELQLQNVLHVPDVTRNLLSVPRLTHDNDVFVEFHPFDVFVKDRATRDVLLSGHYQHGLYPLDAPQASQVFSSVRVKPSQWHSRLGHPASPIVRHVLHRHQLPIVSSDKDVSVCDACQQGKSHQFPFLVSTRVVKHPLKIVFSDI